MKVESRVFREWGGTVSGGSGTWDYEEVVIIMEVHIKQLQKQHNTINCLYN
jgi:hypothetical protein